MSTRQERVEVFQDTLAWIREDAQLKQALEAAQKATKVFYEDDYPEFDASKRVNTRISVSRDRSFQAAMRLKREHPEARVAVMNFANAFHPGGGVAGVTTTLLKLYPEYGADSVAMQRVDLPEEDQKLYAEVIYSWLMSFRVQASRRFFIVTSVIPFTVGTVLTFVSGRLISLMERRLRRGRK